MAQFPLPSFPVRSSEASKIPLPPPHVNKLELTAEDSGTAGEKRCSSVGTSGDGERVSKELCQCT